MSIEKNLNRIVKQIEEAAELAKRSSDEISFLAISKGRSVEELKEAYSCGVRDFGENRLPDACDKMEQLAADVRWHFIGKLQSNKINKAIGKFALIHSVDSVELAEKISRASLNRGVKTAILLQANTSGEKTKSGLSPEEWEAAFSDLLDFEGIEMNGLMTMAPLTEDEGRIRHCFSELRFMQQRLREKGGQLDTLSMGMSNDFPIAIQEGATLVRIGTVLFTPQ